MPVVQTDPNSGMLPSLPSGKYERILELEASCSDGISRGQTGADIGMVIGR